MTHCKEELAVNFIVEPPILVRWLGDDERDRRLLLLDIDIDAVSGNRVRMDLNLVFTPKEIRRGQIQPADFYVGSTGAQLRIRLTRGEVVDYSEGRSIDVSYSNSTNSTRKSNLTIEPGATLSLGKGQVAAGVGTLTFEKGSSRSTGASFQASERVLETEFSDPAVKWVLVLPRGERAVRDFLQGNLLLFAECRALDEGIEGQVEVRTSNILFFGPDRRSLGRVASIRMLFALWQQDRKILSQDPEKIYFRINKIG